MFLDCIMQYITPQKFWAQVKLGASGCLRHGLKRQNANKLSPDKSMMPLRYDLEIFAKYLVPKCKIRPQISAWYPYSNGDIGPRKTQKISFSPKWC